MNTITFYYLAGLDIIPPFKDTVEALRTKYGYPLKYFHDPTSNTGGRTGVTQPFYDDFNKLNTDIVKYLKDEFPIETVDGKLFYDNLQNLANPWGMTSQHGLDAWIAGQTRPAPHGGYPGYQWQFENSPTGRVSVIVPTLIRDYNMCVKAKAERLAKEVVVPTIIKKQEKVIVPANKIIKPTLYTEIDLHKANEDFKEFFRKNGDQSVTHALNQISYSGALDTFKMGFLYTKIQELETENAKLRAEFKEVLTALTIKKPVGEEIAELQERIMKLYSGKN